MQLYLMCRVFVYTTVIICKSVIYLLNIAAFIVWLIPDMTEQAARRSQEYHIEMIARIIPVGELLLLCSHCSSSMYVLYVHFQAIHQLSFLHHKPSYTLCIYKQLTPSPG